MKRICLLILCIVCVLFCSGQELSLPKRVLITGRVVNANDSTPRVIKGNFQNPFKAFGQSVKLDSFSRFRLEEEMVVTQNITVNYGNWFINLLVHPGDSIHLVIDASLMHKNNFEWLSISGDYAQINRQLNLCADYIYRLPSAKWNYALSPDKMLIAVKENYQRYLDSLDRYADRMKLHPTVVKWAQCEVKYVIANFLVDYVDPSGSIDSIQMQKVSLFKDKFFDIYNPDNFQSMMFVYHLSQYMYLITRTDTVFSRHFNSDNVSEAVRRGLNILSMEPVGISRDYMTYKFLSYFLIKNPAVRDSIEGIDRLFSTAEYANASVLFFDPKYKLVFPETPIKGISYLISKNAAEPVPEVDFIGYLAKKYPGKVLFIDVFATWCGPCRVEHKKAPEIHKLFQGKDVVFINLCLSSDMEKWKKMVANESIHGENYFFDEDASKLFMGVYQLSGYPSFLLANKSGKLVTNRAPRPSEKNQLVEKINLLLAYNPPSYQLGSN